ncbi:MAG: folate-binding protein [Congregibacter sp.]|nr:folate-binding protein [Congregibacter sp.]
MSGFACFLANEAMIHLRGQKISAFLQGQLTCDTRKLTDTRAVMGALCNVKGRVLSDLTVLQVSDSHVILRLRKSLAPRIVETLRRYAQFSRISVELDLRDQAIMGLREAGKPPGSQPEPASGLSVLPGNTTLTLQRGPGLREILSVDPASPADLSIAAGDSDGNNDDNTNESNDENNQARWALEILRGGHYALELDDLEGFTPQALNYDIRGLVAFDKGCYTGQEIVARLHYKGQSKRRLQVFEAACAAGLLIRETPVFSADGKAVGRCLRAEHAADSPVLVATEIQSDHLGKDAYLVGGEHLKAQS